MAAITLNLRMTAYGFGALDQDELALREVERSFNLVGLPASFPNVLAAFDYAVVSTMDRRSLLSGLAVIAAAPVILSQSKTTYAAPMPAEPAMPLADIKNAAQFYMGVIGRAELSLATSHVAVEKITNKNALEFAGFELGEAITVNMVLKDIGTPAPAMDDTAKATVEKMIVTSRGAEFDHEYIKLQLQNHEALRDLADAYLHNSAGATTPEEMQGRHLSSLMLAVFKEHVAICKRISSELKA